MTTVGDIYTFLNEFAPVSLAEEWDNVGLLCGDQFAEVKKALVALDVTEQVSAEAAKADAQLIVSHHPVIFHPLHSVTAQNSVVFRLAASNISAICMHTNLDICPGGVADVLAERLGVEQPSVLLPLGRMKYDKLIVFVPRTHAEIIREAIARAGAGKLGQYDSCSFLSNGTGCFRPLDGAHPYLGKTGRLERADETKVEAICRAEDTAEVVRAMREVHPYEEPAYDIFPDAIGKIYGEGRIGAIREPKPLREFALFVKETLGCGAIEVCDAGRATQKVAVCNGSCDEEMLTAAAQAGADTVVTGEMKHSLKIEAKRLHLNAVAAGHFETENVICPRLVETLADRFPETAFCRAESGVSPTYFI